MSARATPPGCPDCDEPVAFTFTETSGLGAWKTGGGFNSTPDTEHYVCFSCAKAWKQRLDGPLTPDVVGDLAFFTCRRPECGAALTITRHSLVPTEVELVCASSHTFTVGMTDEGGLTLVDALRS
jgi:hypothetical protein